MLKLTNFSTSYPVMFENKNNDYEPGQIAQVDLETRIASVFDGTSYPCGIIAGSSNEKHMLVCMRNRSIFKMNQGPCILITDQYVNGLNYNFGAYLYANMDGKITTKENEFRIGIVLGFSDNLLTFELIPFGFNDYKNNILN